MDADRKLGVGLLVFVAFVVVLLMLAGCAWPMQPQMRAGNFSCIWHCSVTVTSDLEAESLTTGAQSSVKTQAVIAIP